MYGDERNGKNEMSGKRKKSEGKVDWGEEVGLEAGTAQMAGAVGNIPGK
jgi:hypothetical protein